MKEKKKIPWGLLYVALTVVILLMFGLVNREFRSMPALLAGLSLGFIVLAVLMTGVFLVIEGEIIRAAAVVPRGARRLLDDAENRPDRHLLFLYHAELHGRPADAGRLPAAR